MTTFNKNTVPFIHANWPAPANVCAVTTLRYPGASQPPYDGFNLGLHVGDNDEHVLQNRQQLQIHLKLAYKPTWLEQVHGTDLIELPTQITTPKVDGSYTQKLGYACVVMTADCLPILLCDAQGTTVCALHVGWRGLVGDIIEKAIATLPVKSTSLIAWLGPAISQAAFEIGDDVKDILAKHPSAPAQAFRRNQHNRWYADLYALARTRLHACGVEQCFGGEYCTFSEPKRFYSYRRDGQQTGRQASLIWLM